MSAPKKEVGRRRRPTMKTKRSLSVFAIIGTLLVGMFAGGTAIATSAFAWGATLTADASCNGGGTYKVIYTLNNPENEPLSIVSSDIPGLIAGSTIAANGSKTGQILRPLSVPSVTGSVTVNWPSDQTPHPYSETAQAPTNCTSGTPYATISFTQDGTCDNPLAHFVVTNLQHATANPMSGDVQPGQSVPVTVTTDAGYVFPDGSTSYVEHAINAFSTDSCAMPPVVIDNPVVPAVNPATCTTDGSLNPLSNGDGYTASYDRPFDGPGTYTAVYTADATHKFASGTTYTVSVTVDSKLAADQCKSDGSKTTPVPPAPIPVDACSNIAGDQATVPTGYTVTNGVCTQTVVTPPVVNNPPAVVVPINKYPVQSPTGGHGVSFWEQPRNLAYMGLIFMGLCLIVVPKRARKLNSRSSH